MPALNRLGVRLGAGIVLSKKMLDSWEHGT